MNATDVTGGRWELRKGLLETPLHKQETKRTWQLPMCQYLGGGGAQPGGRQSFQSLRRARWRGRFPVLSGLVSGRMGVPFHLVGRLAPSAKYLFWG